MNTVFMSFLQREARGLPGIEVDGVVSISRGGPPFAQPGYVDARRRRHTPARRRATVVAPHAIGKLGVAVGLDRAQ
jgi:hypothetical protein